MVECQTYDQEIVGLTCGLVAIKWLLPGCGQMFIRFNM